MDVSLAEPLLIHLEFARNKACRRPNCIPPPKNIAMGLFSQRRWRSVNSHAVAQPRLLNKRSHRKASKSDLFAGIRPHLGAKWPVGGGCLSGDLTAAVTNCLIKPTPGI
ncbi:hypothetical protein MTP99_017551 [Tenebrio molitor]|nr:hypothetical protein MTP99_017551 [Tenebrio molitor]